MNLYSSDKIVNNFCSLMKEKRESLGYTQSDISTKLNLTQTHYSFMERGKRRISMSQMIDIACVLDIDLVKFFQSQTLPRKRERKERRLQLLLKESSVEKLGVLADQMQTSKNALIQNLIDVFAVFCDNLSE